MTYRPDIDGLRALAILPVLLFHAKVPGFGGGFVGVDVFFVISGYLITTLILNDIDRKQFSLMRFWERRVRRILPALIAVVIFVLVAGWFLYLPFDFKNLGQSATAQSLFASNFLFWTEAGYFGEDAEVKPLLHTWSLAVEEQFYLLFPFLAVALRRFSRKSWVIVIAILGGLSFGVNLWLSQTQPTAAFFLLPARAWELLLGALVAVAPAEWGHRTAGSSIRAVLSVLALLAIGIAVLLFNRTTRFPGVAAALPTVGAAVLIWANAGAPTPIGRVLSHRLLVGVGLISYSLYLWHWPLLVFSEYLTIDGGSLGRRLGVLALSLPLAVASWKLVELPVRRGEVLPNRLWLAVSCAIALGCIAVVGAYAHISGGTPQRFSSTVVALDRGRLDYNPRQAECRDISPARIDRDDLCKLGPPGAPPILLSWGDSHADAIMPLLETMASDYGVPVWHAARATCAPAAFSVFGRYGQPGCAAFNQALLRSIDRHGIRHVLLSGRWWIHVETQGDGPPGDISDTMRNVLAGIRALRDRGVTVWILQQVPEQKGDVPLRLAKLALHGEDITKDGTRLAAHERLQASEVRIWRSLGDEIRVLNPTALLCHADGICHTVQGDRPIYRDLNHLSNFGVTLLRPVFEPFFEAMARSK